MTDSNLYINADGTAEQKAVPLLSENDASYLHLEATPIAAPQSPQQVLMVQTHQPQQQPYTVQQVNTNSDLDNENYLYTGRVSDLTICHWLACLFCNCCGCALVGFILNEIVSAAKKAGYFKLAFFVSQKAKCWMVTACVCTLIPWIVLCVLFAGGWIQMTYITDHLQDLRDGNN